MPVPQLSYSGISTYLECPLRWKFLYIDRLPETPRGYFSFGRTVHSVLEELLRPLVLPSARVTSAGETQRTLDDWDGARGAGGAPARLVPKSAMLERYSSLWVSEGYTSPEEESRYRALGLDLLSRYYDRISNEHPSPVAVEEHLEAKWDGIPVHGYIDRIDRTPTGGLEVVDYKTSRELSNEDAEGSDQLTLYQVLVERNYADPVEKLTLYHLRSLTPLRTSKRSPATLTSLFDRVGTVHDGIRSEAYEPKPGRHCTRCDFRAMCPEFKNVPENDRRRLATLVDRFVRLREEEARLDGEIRSTAEALHREAEELGVHRLPGSQETLLRRREESWKFPIELVRPILVAHGLEDRVDPLDPESVRRLVRDRSVDAEVRRKIAETGGRKLRWYWEREEGAARD